MCYTESKGDRGNTNAGGPALVGNEKSLKMNENECLWIAVLLVIAGDKETTKTTHRPQI